MSSQNVNSYGFDQEGRQDGPINTIVIGPLMNLF
jgi:hypothetical protein